VRNPYTTVPFVGFLSCPNAFCSGQTLKGSVGLLRGLSGTATNAGEPSPRITSTHRPSKGFKPRSDGGRGAASMVLCAACLSGQTGLGCSKKSAILSRPDEHLDYLAVFAWADRANHPSPRRSASGSRYDLNPKRVVGPLIEFSKTLGAGFSAVYTVRVERGFS